MVKIAEVENRLAFRFEFLIRRMPTGIQGRARCVAKGLLSIDQVVLVILTSPKSLNLKVNFKFNFLCNVTTGTEMQTTLIELTFAIGGLNEYIEWTRHSKHTEHSELRPSHETGDQSLFCRRCCPGKACGRLTAATTDAVRAPAA